MQYIAYFVTAVSIVGTVANSFQKWWCFWVWICTNTFWTVYNIISGSYAQALLYAFNFIMAVIGLIKWRQKEKTSTHKPPTICKIKTILLGTSPSLALSKCTLRRRSVVKKCEGCLANIPNMINAGLQEGLRSVENGTKTVAENITRDFAELCINRRTNGAHTKGNRNRNRSDYRSCQNNRKSVSKNMRSDFARNRRSSRKNRSVSRSCFKCIPKPPRRMACITSQAGAGTKEK